MLKLEMDEKTQTEKWGGGEQNRSTGKESTLTFFELFLAVFYTRKHVHKLPEGDVSLADLKSIFRTLNGRSLNFYF